MLNWEKKSFYFKFSITESDSFQAVTTHTECCTVGPRAHREQRIMPTPRALPIRHPFHGAEGSVLVPHRLPSLSTPKGYPRPSAQHAPCHREVSLDSQFPYYLYTWCSCPSTPLTSFCCGPSEYSMGSNLHMKTQHCPSNVIPMFPKSVNGLYTLVLVLPPAAPAVGHLPFLQLHILVTLEISPSQKPPPQFCSSQAALSHQLFLLHWSLHSSSAYNFSPELSRDSPCNSLSIRNTITPLPKASRSLYELWDDIQPASHSK